MFIESPKTLMMFGAFDGIHPGHEYLINFGIQHSSKIIIVVAQDSIIEKNKKQKPIHKLNVRMRHLLKKFPQATIIPGDIQQGTWAAIKDHRPDTVLVGYDQTSLLEALKDIQIKYNLELIQGNSFFPKKYKSSLLRTNN